MAHPVDPSFGRTGEYTTQRTAVEAFRDGAYAAPRSMYHGNNESEPITWWMRVQMHADSIRDAMGDKCCRCLHHMPSLVLIVGAVLLICLAVAAVPLVFVIVSNSGDDPSSEPLSGLVGKSFEPIRRGLQWPGYVDDEPDEEDTRLRAISSSALFPPNVDLCHGFGFACVSTPSVIISTTQRCDGKFDCADGSDEANCRECQSPFFCESASSKVKKCLRSEQLCNGQDDCEDGADERAFCRNQTATCPEGTRRCARSPLCLAQEAVCDGETDCPHDDDEMECKTCTRGAKMCKPTNRCIPRSQLCDGEVQCPDGSDEQQCDCKLCSGSKRALCGNGRCVDRSRVCDGAIDCEDGQDEESCPGTCAAPVNASSPVPKEMVLCADGRRYPKTEACSGQIRACERSCDKCDSRLAFTCSTGECIRKMLVCDGRKDCPGGEDEQGCGKTCSSAKGPVFKCAVGGQCIAKSSQCDGVRDCIDGSDEVECEKCSASDAFYCKRDKRCFPAVARCDGTEDCSDGSDETKCTCEECTVAHSETYSCESSGHCFRRDNVCNPYSRCPNATHADKLFCAARALKFPVP